jgi:pyrroloquinoline-quinone synthase
MSGKNPFPEVARRHPLWIHPFLGRCREGRLELWDVRALAVQMYRFTQAFTGILASALVRCPDEEVRLVVAENLWEEMGEGDAERCHAALFRRFTRAIGISDAELHAAPILPGTQRLIDTYVGLADRYGYIGALGAVCYASEGIVSSLYRAILTGIEGAVPVPREALAFFDVHLVVDTGHADKLERVVNPRVKTAEQAHRVRAAIREAMDARVAFFDDVDADGRAMDDDEWLLTEGMSP